MSKVVVVSGASRGLGRALSIALVERGYRVAGLARSVDGLSAVEQACHGIGSSGAFMGIRVDVTCADEVLAAIKKIESEWGAIDTAIANAGISSAGWAARQTSGQVNELMQVNFMGMVNLFVPVLPGMIARGHGQLAGIASIAAYRGMPALSAYSASKAAMRNYLETLRIELRPRGIAVSIISPGYIDTDMTVGGGRPMPFKISAEKAATIIVEALERNTEEVIFPLIMSLVTRLLLFSPNSLYDRLIRLMS